MITEAKAKALRYRHTPTALACFTIIGFAQHHTTIAFMSRTR